MACVVTGAQRLHSRKKPAMATRGTGPGARDGPGRSPGARPDDGGAPGPSGVNAGAPVIGNPWGMEAGLDAA